MAEPVRVSVVVPARDAAATIGRTLACLTAQQPPDGGYEVIVVDDGSRDGTVAIADRVAQTVSAGPDSPAKTASSITLVRRPPLGPAAARNAGVAAARGELLAFCDADVFPEPGWLRAGTAALAQADLVQGRVLPDPRSRLGPFDRTIWVTGPSGLFEAASLFVRRSAFDQVGGFGEWIRPAFGGKGLAEDVWFGWRLRRAGARTGFCEEALAYHAVFPRSWTGQAAERARLRFFPAMVARMPELREQFLHRRLFLNSRTLRFDLALAGLLAARLTRSRLPLLAMLPYARRSWRESGRAGRPSAAVVAADLAADAVGAAALAVGAVQHRTPVL